MEGRGGFANSIQWLLARSGGALIVLLAARWRSCSAFAISTQSCCALLWIRVFGIAVDGYTSCVARDETAGRCGVPRAALSMASPTVCGSDPSSTSTCAHYFDTPDFRLLAIERASASGRTTPGR